MYRIVIFIGALNLIISCNSDVQEATTNSSVTTTETKMTFSINGVVMDSIVGKKSGYMNDGIWEYYSEGQLMRKTLFDKGKEIYFIENGDTVSGSFFEEYADQYPSL